MIFKKDQLKKEVAILNKRESKYLKKQMEVNPSILQRKLEEKVPDKLQATLDVAFTKAFSLVFEKGTAVIEKTYNKAQHEQDFQVNTYAVGLEKNKKNLRAFSKQAGTSKSKNLLVSGVEGVGLGLLGIGLPDIPIFTGVLLKSIYEIALSYGFSYETEEEQCFILRIIEVSLMHGEELVSHNQKLNDWIEVDSSSKIGERKTGIENAAKALSGELLYMKFLQGLPIVGVVGGAFDAVYLHKITGYADIKYRKRFYLSQKGTG